MEKIMDLFGGSVILIIISIRLFVKNYLFSSNFSILLIDYNYKPKSIGWFKGKIFRLE